MGKRFGTKQVDDGCDHRQPGCISGLVRALAQYQWHYNVRKMINRSKYEGPTFSKSNLRPKENLFQNDACDVKKLVVEDESPFLTTKRSRRTYKRSPKSSARNLSAEVMYKESDSAKHREGLLLQSRLQRTYSIHHQEMLDGSIGKVCTDWKHPIIFIPSNGEAAYGSRSPDITDRVKAVDENGASSGEFNSRAALECELIQEPDILDILKVDKELFIRNLWREEEGVAHFSRSTAGLNRKENLSKSRSFPVRDLSRKLKFKPIKLEHKQKEVWLFPKRDNSNAINQELKLAPLDYLENRSGHLLSSIKDESADQHVVFDQEKLHDNGLLMPSDVMAGITEKREEDVSEGIDYYTVRNHYHRRSASLNESMDKYTRLFENSYAMNNKLHQSKSLKLTIDNSHAPMYFRRLRSLSSVDPYYTSLDFEATGYEPFGDGSNAASSLSLGIPVGKEEKKAMSLIVDTDNEPQDSTVEYNTKPVDCFACIDKMEDDAVIGLDMVDDTDEKWEVFDEEVDELRSSDSFIEAESNRLDHRSSKDPDNLSPETLSHVEQLQTYEGKLVKSFDHNKNDSDLCYMRYVLDQSGIAENASDREWHSSEQLLSPKLFEEVEACWPHEVDQFTTALDLSSCWHHQMLFDSINEVLLNIYDTSLPYYPKALSSSCRVPPFPAGKLINEEVTASIQKLLELKSKEKESLDCVMTHDLGTDNRWMNLQYENESVALELEDMIFNELLQEFVSRV